MQSTGRFGLWPIALVCVGLGLPRVSLAQQRPLPSGKVQVIGKIAKKPRRDGGKVYQYYQLNKGERGLKLRVGGPTNLVVLVRGLKNQNADLRLRLDDRPAAQSKLGASVKRSRGLFLTVPAGTHEIHFSADVDLLLRPQPVKRPGPVGAEVAVTWPDSPPVATPAPKQPEPEPPVRAPIPEPTPPPKPLPPEPLAAEVPEQAEPPAPSVARLPAPRTTAPAAGEQVSEQVLPPPEPPRDPTGPSTFGQQGLWRTWSAVPQEPTIAVGLWAEYFSIGDYLVSGDDDQRMGTRLTISGTPMAGLELNAGFSLVSNNNPAFEPADTRSIGDPFLGVRYGYRLLDWFGLGVGIQAVFPSGLGFTQLSSKGISTRILFAFEATPLPGLLLALNLGYHFDNSRFVFDDPLNPAQAFSAGVNPHDQVLVQFGAAYQIGPVAPFLEWGASPAVGGGAPGFADSPGWLTIGLRAWPLGAHDLHLVAAIDVGLTGVDAPAGKGRIPPYNLIVAVAWNFGATPPEVRLREVVRTERVEVPVRVTEPAARQCQAAGGRVAGKVVDANTGQPIGGAKVVVAGHEPQILLTDASDGRFATCPSRPGPLKLSIFAEGYSEQSEVALVGESGDSQLVIQMQPATGPTFGMLKGSVRALTGLPLPALISIPAHEIQLRAGRTGKFERKLPSGSYDVLISMPGYVTQRRKVKLGPGDTIILNITLDPAK